MLEFLTKENVTFILALIGSIGTLISCINKYMQRRINISAEFHGFSKGELGILTYLSISNNSNIPISIISVSLKIGNTVFKCSPFPICVYRETNTLKDVEIDKETIYSIKFPISLSSLFADGGYLYFELPQEVLQNLSTQATALIHTNRNKVIQKTLDLNKVLPLP